MSGTFAPLSRFPFTAVAAGYSNVDDAGTLLDLTLPAGFDYARANTLLLQNSGTFTVWFVVGDSNAVAVAPTAPDVLDVQSCPLLPGAIITYPCPPVESPYIATICASGDTTTLLVARGWGQ